jgi:16S rRNA (uracil1498-N3)-methyltransferase
MRVPRLLVETPLVPDTRCPLPPEVLQHCVTVLRLRDGAACRVFDGQGAEHHATLELAGRRAAFLHVGAIAAAPTTPRLRLRLLQGIARGEHMDLAVQKAVELGVAEIWPVLCARSLSGGAHRGLDRRWQHWQGILRAAAEQCGRNELPLLAPARALREALDALPPGARAVADATGQPLAAWPARLEHPDAGITLLVGPEGGLEAGELTAAGEFGFEGLQLGPRVLRTETAALVGLAALQLRYGDLT